MTILKMQNSQNTSAQEEADANVFVLSVDAVSYQMVLPHAATDYIQRKLATEHAPYELDMLKDMQNRLSDGDLVLDAGANIGNHTMFLAAAVGCQVAAFEPNQVLADALLSSVRLNHLQERVKVCAHALGKMAERGHFAKDIPDNLGAQSIESGDGPLEIKTLDSLDFATRVKAIKIDVEGMELDVLNGGAALIAKDRPILYVECQTESNFRTIHNWMVAKNYGYWDTFNATPTHLFLPNEQTTVDQRLSRLQFKIAQDAYLVTQQIANVRQQLDGANLKYRASTEQVATLKTQLAQEEGARRQAEKNAAEAAAKLQQTRDRLEQERVALQLEVTRLGAQGQAHGQVAHDAEKQLIRLETALESTRTNLNESNLKYRGATEQIDVLKQCIAQEQLAARQAAEDAALRATRIVLEKAEKQDALHAEAAKGLERQLAQLNGELATVRGSLTEANQKYRSATEQISALKLKAGQDEVAAKVAAELIKQGNVQLTQTQMTLLEQRAALQKEISQLSKEGLASSNAAHEVEKRMIRLEAETEQVRASLTDANTKYRSATGLVAELKERLAHEEQAHRTVVALLAQQERRLAQEEQAHGTARALLEEQERRREKEQQAHGAVVTSLAEQERCLAREQQAQRAAAAQIQELTNRLAREEQAASAAEILWGEVQLALDALRREFEDVSANYRSANEHIGNLSARVDEEASAHQEAFEKIAILDQRLEQENRTRRDIEQASEETRLQLEQAQANLNQANLKYRWLTAEEIPKLKTKYEEEQSLTRAQQHELAQLSLQRVANQAALAEAGRQVQRLQQQKTLAEQQVVKTRASLSFQLGYILIHGFKSVRGFINLPGALLAWRKDVVKRRKQKQQGLDKIKVAAAAQQLAPAAPVPTIGALVTASPATKPAWSAPASVAPAPLAALAGAPATEHVSPTASGRTDLRQLKMASVMDEFTFGSYRAECDILQLTPAHWQAELEAFQPELLFIESAWRGKDELWGNKVGHNSQELQGAVAWCRERGVPTVFWNKEDPVHFETFLSTAKLFDYVFTTDIDCIHRYKAALRHARVFLLPFACQPANNNPIETYERKDAFCFAGAYYARYPERTRDLDTFVSNLPAFRPLEIYDRNFGKNDVNYQFPPQYRPYIVGTLPFEQIDKAYKGYRYAINLNSIKQSQSMFARRVFELLASNTITVSNYSRGVRLMFGDLVVTTDSGREMVRHLGAIAGDDMRGGKLRLAGLRKVLQEHTYGQRLAYVFSKVSGQMPASSLPVIAVVAGAASQRELDLVLAHFQRQRYDNCHLTVALAEGFAPTPGAAPPRVRVLAQAQLAKQSMAALTGPADLVAGLLADDYYGPNYLLDIALATLYSPAEVIGKGAHFVWRDGAAQLRQADAAYRPIAQLAARCSAVRLARVAASAANAWIAALDTAVSSAENGLAIDEFNYCRGGGEAPRDAVDAVDDTAGLDTGIAIDELLLRAEQIAPETVGADQTHALSGKQFATVFGKAPSSAVKLAIRDDDWCLESTLADGKHEYMYATGDETVAALGFTGQVKFYLDTTPGLNLQLVLVFLDAQKQKISHVIKHANRNQQADIPLGTVSIRFGLRIYAGGSADIKGLVLGHRDLQAPDMLGRSEHLVLTNHYPSYDDLYRNAFVHSRISAYRERGIHCDVFRLRPDEAVSYHEFENVDVISGAQDVLNQMLASGRYKSVLVHFLSPAMWEVLQHHIERIKLVVWVHGADIQPWHRRGFNYVSDDERAVAKMKSDARMDFWRGLLGTMPANLKLVFVSRYSAEEVMEDLGFRIPEDHYAVIHNPIDTDVFSYQGKPADQRKKVLSIRPYASATYANDLSVKAIQILSSKPWFKDMAFHMIGDGPLFEETLAPLRQYPNVYIEKRFLKRDEIAACHKENGIFLCPTRMDTHGVSRDEAMASGLVPVTNAVAAIPEFVDAQCGMLAKGEDAEELALAIAQLYENPEHFLVLSNRAAQRVRSQSAKEKMIALELQLL